MKGMASRTGAGTLLLLLLLGGCDLLEGGHDQVAACEAFIKAGLTAPSSYARTRLLVTDSPLLSAREFQARMRDAKPPPEPQVRLRTVSIAYEAKNALGVALPATEYCHFKLTEAQRTSELIRPHETPRAAFDARERQWAREEAAAQAEDPFGTPPPSRRFGCCLPPAGR